MEDSYSVLMSVYYKENPVFLSLAIKSILEQTLKTDDFVIVCDGELTDDLNAVLSNFSNENSCIHVYRLETNVGLGLALKFGITKCIHDIVMRMDSDDYSLPDRAEKQFSTIKDGADITCGAVAEFNDDYNSVNGIRQVPLNRKEMRSFIKRRCPFNHPCVMYKKSLVLSVGNYRHFPFREDYDLWIRIFLSDCSIQNTNDVLVHMRIGNGMMDRRFSKQSKESSKLIRKELLKSKLINKFEYVIYSFAEWIIRISPRWFKRLVYRKVLRK